MSPSWAKALLRIRSSRSEVSRSLATVKSHATYRFLRAIPARRSDLKIERIAGLRRSTAGESVLIRSR